ncbi:MAG: hypothetical protein HY560_13595 [Gemmatimonadetes bacterium]|nr:hypothetical protein [Gemmatimonadota bacterium]
MNPVLVGLSLLLWACTPKQPADPAPAPVIVPPPAPVERVVVETVTVRDPELERRVARLEFQLLEREAQLEEAQTRVDEARLEVVRAMARLRTLATRAEAASGMAEADVALEALRNSAGQQPPSELAQARRLLELAGSEFNKENYGGALYLATQAKNLAAAGRGRLAGDSRDSLRAGETVFALPLRLRATSRGNVREGPGQRFRVAYSIESGAPLTGYSYVDEWVRVTDQGGRPGWIFRNLVGRR